MNSAKSAYTLPVPGLVATYEGRDCLLMPLVAGEETTLDLGPYRITIRTPDAASNDPS